MHAVAASAPPPAPLASPPPAPMNATIQAPLLPTAPVESSGPAINRDPIFGAEIHWYTGLIWCSFLLLYSGLLLFIPAYAVGGSLPLMEELCGSMNIYSVHCGLNLPNRKTTYVDTIIG